MNHNNQKHASLAQHFDAPDDYIGYFGWLCGYSADALFLNAAAERFTRQTASQRAHIGNISLAVLLDPGNPYISLVEAPGVAHVPIRKISDKPFKLLHAKVALLGFRHKENPDKWQVRLLVSTGNWTRQTMEESLDLIWRVDIDSEMLEFSDEETPQSCADIKAAWNLISWISGFFDLSLLNVSTNSHIVEQVVQWIEICAENAKGKSRFFDNRDKSLLAQLPQKIKSINDVKRNYLAMGSGFYEESKGDVRLPDVPIRIIENLKKNGVLTNNPIIDLYVNHRACQSIATAVDSLQEHGVTIRPAATPCAVFGDAMERSLHAKFLFSANHRDESNVCSSAWVYLGSGNLTNPGFSNSMSRTAGNLEAGVVFSPEKLHWYAEKKISDQLVIVNLLPIQWDKEFKDSDALDMGAGMEDRDNIYTAAPITWLNWHKEGDIQELRAPVEETANFGFQIFDSIGQRCLRTDTGFRWNESQPRQVLIKWEEGDQLHELYIPVVDQYGRIAATELTTIDIDEAWWQLADFPLQAAVSGEDDSEDNTDKYQPQNGTNGSAAQITQYPIRQMMEIIENIAAKQTEIHQMDWLLWCTRLKQTLMQACDSEPVKYFRDELKLNPLSPLLHKSFRPSFAETDNSESGKFYEDVLSEIQDSWMVKDLTKIGDIK